MIRKFYNLLENMSAKPTWGDVLSYRYKYKRLKGDLTPFFHLKGSELWISNLKGKNGR